ncbi:hypothetical protein G6F62_014777 [Rhizopus arrhizus]|nr:hypothetical protein G6F62_014777 [Rhizopus arrhizus]
MVFRSLLSDAFKPRLVIASAAIGSSTMDSAICRARSWISSCGWISNTMPISLASCAWNSRVEKASSLARCRPTMRGRVYIVAQSGMAPSRRNDRQKRARGDARIRSAVRARPSPAP